jgi:outer membrane protein OmpA-like peptidoglycan-associated protein
MWMLDEPSSSNEQKADETSTRYKYMMTPPTIASFAIIVLLLGFLITLSIRGGSMSAVPEESRISRAKADVAILHDNINQQRLNLGLSPLVSSSESLGDIASRLKNDASTLVALASSYQEILSEKDTQLTLRSAELVRSEKDRQNLFAENSRIQADLNRALIASSELDPLRRDILNSKAQRDAFSAELTSMRQKMATMSDGASKDDLANLQRQLEETRRAKDFFEARTKELEAELAKTKLFASSENELLPAAVQLFRELRKLENLPDSAISSAYSGLAIDLGANVLKTLNFTTGSSILDPADAEAIRALVNDTPDGDLLLAIGYASETGNVDSNRSLSSDRATSAAEFISSIKRPGQLTQAVYLGQTDRFGSRVPERNQLVEIWRIHKK